MRARFHEDLLEQAYEHGLGSVGAMYEAVAMAPAYGAPPPPQLGAVLQKTGAGGKLKEVLNNGGGGGGGEGDGPLVLDPTVPGPFGPTPPGFVAPGAVTIRPSNWDLDRQIYTVAGGDTLVGLAATYLRNGSRFLEIWNIQSTGFRLAHNNNPGVLFVGDELLMPDEAVKNFLATLDKPKPGDPPIAPGEPRGQAPPALQPKKGLSTGAKVALGLGAAALAVGGVYVASK